ncbi:MAG: NAD+ kinase [Spirochaetia bacterium]|nr:NAD+ kinase [Spirochaetia bacterium]
MSFEKVILVTRPTRLQDTVKRYNTKAQAAFYITRRGQSFSDYELEDETYAHAREDLLKIIPSELKVQIIDRSFLPNFLFAPTDVVVCLGQDGLVVNTAKYLSGQPVIAVNPDPDRFDGVLLPFQVQTSHLAFEAILEGRQKTRNITMARVDLNDGQHLYAFNDLFLGPKTHISARYTIHIGEKSERQMSSGILVSTPAGSTGWFSSLLNQTRGLSRFGGAAIDMPVRSRQWEDRELTFAVREPFASKWSGVEMVAGTIKEKESISVESHMAENGVIFSDGMEQDFLTFNSGATATVGIAEKTTELVIHS